MKQKELINELEKIMASTFDASVADKIERLIKKIKGDR